MLKIKNLKCEYARNPVGIGEKRPRFSWIINSDGKKVMQTAYHIQVSEDNSFRNILWDSGIAGSEDSIHVEYRGPELNSRTRYYFRVKIRDNKNNESPWSRAGFFETAMFDNNGWKASFISSGKSDTSGFSACPLFRREFSVKRDFISARVYVTALGLYELWINGKRVGEDLLTPGWTNYRKRLQYQTYDVIALLRKGTNAIGAMVANGWYRGYVASWMENSSQRYGKKTALLLQIYIKYSDGTEDVIVSDKNWKTTRGPLIMSELYHGETYDARLEIPGWNRPGIDDSTWAPARELKINKRIIIPREGVPVRRIEYIKPGKVIKTPRGETVIDMGQNMVGWMHFTVTGKKGSRVVLKHAEVLDKDGNFYTANLRSAKQRIEYILRGEGKECFEPHFSFQGFRYVKIEKYPGKPALKNFTGVAIHTLMEKTGSFKCSNKLVNSLQSNILWGQKGNFIDIPTDCPQRDERLGWTGDAQVFSRTACFNMDTALFFKKWLRDLKSEQLENGGVPYVIPAVKLDVLKFVKDKVPPHSACGWGDAAVICPWNVYLCYGDLRIIREQYDSMKAWVEYVKSQAEDGLIWNKGFHFGDWLALDSKEGSYFGATPNDLVATAFYAYSTGILARAAKLLRRNKEAKHYSHLHKNIIEAFQNKFFTTSGQLTVHTQTAHVLALMFGLVRKKDIKRTVDTLVGYLKDNNWHLDTGFLGTPYLCHVLSDNGRTDVAYRLLLQTDYPSWLYQVLKGATTIWEHWDGIKEDGSFWSARMNSFNHYAYGSIGDWLYRVVAGIDTDENKAGYKRIILRPHPCSGLRWAAAEFRSMYGLIKIRWSYRDGVMEVKITVPHNTKALALLPYATIDSITESGVDIDRSVYGQFREMDSGVELELGSGDYSFSYPVDAAAITDILN